MNLGGIVHADDGCTRVENSQYPDGTADPFEPLDLKTPMTAPIYADKETRDGINALTPWGEWGEADDVAKCAVFLASDDAAYVTGVPLLIDGGYTAQ